jgi:hypothetical protein
MVRPYTKSDRRRKHTRSCAGRDQAFLAAAKDDPAMERPKKVVEVPLFHSYLFIYIKGKEQLPALQVDSIVRFC